MNTQTAYVAYLYIRGTLPRESDLDPMPMRVSIQEVKNFEIEIERAAAKIGIDPAQIYDIFLNIYLQIRQTTSGQRVEPDNQTTPAEPVVE